jgi:23S rRNA pseudouridine1911/1915/1917 synthase
MVRIEVTDATAGERLDKLLVKSISGLGRAGAKRLFAERRVTVLGPDGKRRAADKGAVAKSGEVVMVEGAGDVAAQPDAELVLTVALERADVVVVDKPAGVPSAPLRPGETGTIANALAHRYPEMRAIGFSPREPGLCHRLDTGTSGLLACARTAAAFDTLTEAIKTGALDKRYLLVCAGGTLPDRGRIDLALAADPTDRRRVAAYADAAEASHRGARLAVTDYQVVRRAGSRALVEAHAARAHRHQIRAHFAAIGAPLVGDALYGGEAVDGLTRHALHASALSWAGNAAVAGFEVRSELPAELAALVRAIS